MSLSKDTNNLAVSAVCKIFHRTPRFKAPANTVQGQLICIMHLREINAKCIKMSYKCTSSKPAKMLKACGKVLRKGALF